MSDWKKNFNKKKPSRRRVLYNTKEQRFVTEEEYEALQKLHDEKTKEIKKAIEDLPNETTVDKEIRESFEEELAKNEEELAKKKIDE